MRVLVTGNKGYIGTVVTPMLAAAGHEVVGLDSGLFDQCSFGADAGPDVPCIDRDIRDVRPADLDGFDAVVHLAGLCNDPLGNLNPMLTYEINCLATARLASLAREAGVRRFLFSSSCSLYGAAGDALLDESAGFRPVTPYGRSKMLAERALAKLATDDFSPTYLRNATAYGVSPRLRFDLVLNNLVAWAASTGRVYIKSDGAPWRPIVHIEDIARAFLAVLNAPRERVHDQAFNVGVGEENYRVRRIAEIVAEVVPGCRIEYADDAGPDARCYRVDCSKLRRVLPEFSPRWTARRGAEELYRACRSAEVTPEEFEGSRYKRVEYLKQLIAGGRVDPTLRWVRRTPVPQGAIAA